MSKPKRKRRRLHRSPSPEGSSSARDDPRGMEPELDDITAAPLLVEGRKCGLCGRGSSEGEPPAGRKNAEERDVSKAGLGRLLGPLSDRIGVAGVWVHQECAVWSPEVYFLGVGCLKNVRAALRRGRYLKCSGCGEPGATIGCRVERCPQNYHLPCARSAGCCFDHRKFLTACSEHMHLFRPSRKRKYEADDDENIIKRNERRDGKFVESNLEDEEFIKRERRRLQRDLARLAPIEIGGNSAEKEVVLCEGWESVGGLKNVVQCLKEMVTLPLLYPEAFQKIGIDPPRGVLLHGSPGTGKTLVVRALLGACANGPKKIAYFARKGADCLGKYVGDSERQLRLLFQLAQQRQPSIIFFDEIDGLAPKRSKNNQDQTQSSVVSTLLALMDGLSSRGSVVVIAATNRPDALDPALRRPGRFDREVYFPLPSTSDREAILKVHTKKWAKPPCENILSIVSKVTTGFAGADLQALCTQAAMVALKRHISLSQLLRSPQLNALPILPEIHVKAQDWVVALSQAAAPCSRRGSASSMNELQVSPLPHHVVPFLLKPVLQTILRLVSDGRFSLPNLTRRKILSIEATHVGMVLEPGVMLSPQTIQHIETILSDTGILADDCNLDFGNVFFGDAQDKPIELSEEQVCRRLWEGEKFRILLAGNPKRGQGLVAGCILNMLQSFCYACVLNLQTMIQEGGGDLEDGLLHIIGEARRSAPAVIYMPSIDSWALETIEVEAEGGNSVGSNSVASRLWAIFLQAVRSNPIEQSLMFLATSEVPSNEIPTEVLGFFAHFPDGASIAIAEVVPSVCLDMPVCDESVSLAVLERAANRISETLKLMFMEAAKRCLRKVQRSADEAEVMSVGNQNSHSTTLLSPPASVADSSTMADADATKSSQRSQIQEAIGFCGYQLLHYPHFMIVRQASLRLGHGPSLTWDPSTFSWREGGGGGAAAAAAAAGAAADAVAPLNSDNNREAEMVTGEAIVKDVADVMVEDSEEEDKNLGSNANAGVTNLSDAYATKAEDETEEREQTFWGLVAVGWKACRGCYSSGSEVVNDVSKVVELLRERIHRKLKEGVNEWQCHRILIQAGALLDLVESWAYQVRRLENVNPKCESQQIQRKLNETKFQSPSGVGMSTRKVTMRNPKVVVGMDSMMSVKMAVKQVIVDLWRENGSTVSIDEIDELVCGTAAAFLSQFNDHRIGLGCSCSSSVSDCRCLIVEENQGRVELTPLLKIFPAVKKQLGIC